MTIAKNATTADQLFQRALKVMPGGNTRLTVFQAPHPPYASRGQGCYLFDTEGHGSLDFINNYTALIHGHADPDMVNAVSEALQNGIGFSMPTHLEVELAELLTSRIPSMEHMRFVNSGTEAVMLAVKAARAFTGRAKIAKFEGSYHGSYDQVEISTATPPSSWTSEEPVPYAISKGTPQSLLENTVVLRMNNLELTERLLERHRHELAAVIMDLAPARSGAIQAEPEFVRRIRELCNEYGIVLIFDEIISFRAAYGGMQSLVGVKPDLTTIGKFIGGGFPCSAFGGRADIMAVFDPRAVQVYHGGTFNANPIAMIAGLVTMNKLTPEAYSRLNTFGERVRTRLAEMLSNAGIAHQVLGWGSVFLVHLHNRPLREFRDLTETAEESRLRERVYRGLLKRGMYLAPQLFGVLSTPMTELELDLMLGAWQETLEGIHEPA